MSRIRIGYLRWRSSYSPHADGTDRSDPRDAGELYACQITVVFESRFEKSRRLSSMIFTAPHKQSVSPSASFGGIFIPKSNTELNALRDQGVFFIHKRTERQVKAVTFRTKKFTTVRRERAGQRRDFYVRTIHQDPNAVLCRERCRRCGYAGNKYTAR